MTAQPNAELAYKILDHIDAHPESWSQAQWDCGTAACFAGWAVRLSGGNSKFTVGVGTIVVEGPEALVGKYVEDAAMQVLGISDVDRFPADRDADPFSVDNTREDLGRLVAEIFGPRPGGAA